MEINYAPPNSEKPKRRGFWKTAGLALASFLIFYFGLFVIIGRMLSSDPFLDAFFAFAFSLFHVVIEFPILVVFGFALRWLIEKVRTRPLGRRRIVPWLSPAIAGMALIVFACFMGRSPKSLFREYPQMESPSSLTSFHAWWGTAPGDSMYAFRFKIDPSQFPQLIANHNFVTITDAPTISNELLDNFTFSNLSVPQAPIVILYKYSNSQTPLPHIMEVFTTQDHSEVIVCGDN